MWLNRVRFALTCATLLLAAPMAAGSAAAGPADTPAVVPTVAGPTQVDHGQASYYANHHPGAVPAGVNNFGCRPQPSHPYPVVLAHGTGSSAYADYAGIAPLLLSAGYCVFAPNYGGLPGHVDFGLDDVQASAAQVRTFVDHVLSATGAPKIDLVGFSLGATVTRYYVNRLGGAVKVHRWVGLASPTYGGTLYGTVPVLEAIPGAVGLIGLLTSVSVTEEAQGSPIIDGLNAGGDTVAGVQYTTLASRVDEMIQPYTNIALRSPGATNIVLQDVCPQDLSGHFNLVYDHVAQQLLLNMLDPAKATPVRCEAVALGAGIPSVVWYAHTVG